MRPHDLQPTQDRGSPASQMLVAAPAVLLIPALPHPTHSTSPADRIAARRNARAMPKPRDPEATRICGSGDFTSVCVLAERVGGERRDQSKTGRLRGEADTLQ